MRVGGTTILTGDALALLDLQPSASVQLAVTSPPYWGLRDYGVPGQLGLEPTPEEYVAHMVAVFREVRRVLRDDGTLWLNLGDSYAGSGRGGNVGGSSTLTGGKLTKEQCRVARGSQLVAGLHESVRQSGGIGRAWVPPPPGLKQKDLVGIPWMVAFALRADGWYLRQDIIWAKPNPMPESVRDRCTKAHEYLFMLSKSSRYLYDADAMAEPVAAATVERMSQANLANQRGSDRVPGKTNGAMKAVLRKSLPATQARLGAYRDEQRKQDGHGRRHAAIKVARIEAGVAPAMRNKRSVWTVTTKPFKEAHFATFPPDLIEPCILASSRAGDTVLDPFGGAGTTGLVANRHGRHALLLELNPQYVEIARARIGADKGAQFGAMLL